MTCVIDISLLQFGQISIVGTTEHARLVLMTFPFAQQNVGASKKAHPGLGACQSEKLELELARSLCDSGSITNIVCLLSTRVEKKVTTSPDGRLAEARLSSKEVTDPSPLPPPASWPACPNFSF